MVGVEMGLNKVDYEKKKRKKLLILE